MLNIGGTGRAWGTGPGMEVVVTGKLGGLLERGEELPPCEIRGSDKLRKSLRYTISF